MTPPSRRLVLLRHAEAAERDGLDDRERPLTARGERQAEDAGRYLAAHDLVPDLVLCSAALRAAQTWRVVAAALPPGVAVRSEPRLYEASAAAVVNLLAELPDGAGTVLVVAHEPALSAVAGALAGPGSDGALTARVRAHLPPGGLVVLQTDVPWSRLAAGCSRLTTFAAGSASGGGNEHAGGG